MNQAKSHLLEMAAPATQPARLSPKRCQVATPAACAVAAQLF